MKAVVLESFGDASHFHLKEVPLPHPKNGDVRIHIRAAGFNPVDFKIRKGWYGGTAPIILGADCSGVIDALGDDVKEFSVGDEVFALAFGQCSNGSYAEYLCLPIEFIAKKPKNLTFEQAASLPIGALTAYRAMIAPASVKKGDAIFIANCGGGVGSVAVELAKHLQVRTIYSVARDQTSAYFLEKELGLKPEHILLYPGLSIEDMEQKLLAMNSGHLLDATFDFIGGAMKKLCLQLTNYSGHMASAVGENEGFSSPVWNREASIPFNRCLSLHVIFIGAEAFFGPRSSWKIYHRQLAHIGQLLESQAIAPPPSKVLGFLNVDTVKQAHHLLESERVKGKLVMTVSE